jgi:type I restriction enzyme, S subunit
VTALPQGWVRTTLGEIGDYLNGRGFKKTEWRESGRPIIRIQNLTGTSDQFNYFDGEAEEHYIARDGDLLVSWAATLGVFMWRGPEAVINQHIFKVRTRIDPGFHRYLLLSTLNALQRQTHGSGMVHVTKSTFGGTQVALPPLNEQRRIAAAIEEQFSRLDAAQASIGAGSRRSATYRGAVIAQAYTGSSPARKIGDVASLSDGPFGSNLKTSHYVEDGPRVIRLQNIGNGVFRDERAHITDEHYARLAKHAVLPGDVIAASLGDRAPRACLVPPQLGRAIVKADCVRIRPDANVDPSYLMWALNSRPVRMQAAARIKGIGRPRLGLGGIRDLVIPVPSLDRQQRIVAQLEQTLSLVGALNDAVEVAKARSIVLRRAILVRAFRGELVRQDPSDEPASAVLERIRAEREAASDRPRGRRVGA